MTNTITVAELKRRGMAAIEEGLARGPVHIIKRNKQDIDDALAGERSSRETI